MRYLKYFKFTDICIELNIETKRKETARDKVIIQGKFIAVAYTKRTY